MKTYKTLDATIKFPEGTDRESALALYPLLEKAAQKCGVDWVVEEGFTGRYVFSKIFPSVGSNDTAKIKEWVKEAKLIAKPLKGKMVK